ncbi:MAG: radical SAM family heme chaperone HemW [Clostridia bacterium]|nr:radical SAM family heme chaperone HemW [Clostridia bacterium]
MKKKLMLYFHIPFCLSKCAYCAFFSAPCTDEALKAEYTDALIRQLTSFENAKDYSVSSVYFGGGTPTVLGPDRLVSVLSAAREVFCLEENAEITVEANPKTVTRDCLYSLRQGGFNRLSIGVQSFNNGTLKKLNRAHSAEDAVECFAMARSAGFDNISADLIFALPDEDVSELRHSLDSLIALRPAHISVYGLSIEAGTPLEQNYSSYSFPNEEEEERQYELVCRTLKAAGYGHYEISNFALPNKEARHNTGYWERTEYFGFGAAAHSFFKGKRFSSIAHTERYIALTKEGYLAPTDFDSSAVLSKTDAEEERVMLGLRLSHGVELDRGHVPDMLLREGLAEYSEGRVRLTEKGFRVSNAIIGILCETDEK